MRNLMRNFTCDEESEEGKRRRWSIGGRAEGEEGPGGGRQGCKYYFSFETNISVLNQIIKFGLKSTRTCAMLLGWEALRAACTGSGLLLLGGGLDFLRHHHHHLIIIVIIIIFIIVIIFITDILKGAVCSRCANAIMGERGKAGGWNSDNGFSLDLIEKERDFMSWWMKWRKRMRNQAGNRKDN